MKETGFLTSLDSRNSNDGRRWTLLAPLVYVRAPRLHVIEVPTGFTTDLASIPRLFWRIFPPTGPYNRAATVHDYCYRQRLCSRYEADCIFLEAMRDCGVPLGTRWLMFCAVRLGGRRAFRRKQQSRAGGRRVR